MRGTRTAMNGVCRPVIAAMSASGSPVTPARAMTGAASAPKATGAVFASRDTSAALSGAMPAASSIAAEIATGAPNPARDSRSAPKQKAMRIERMRRSSLTERIVRLKTSNHGVTTVSR